MLNHFSLLRGAITFLLVAILAGCAGGGTGSALPKTPEIAMLSEGQHPRIISPFGSWRGCGGECKRNQPHTGVDYAAEVGDPVIAVKGGVVERVLNDEACGLGIVLRHDSHGVYTEYCHFRQGSLKVALRGTFVEQGQVLGEVGKTGRFGGKPHVHLGLHRGRFKPGHTIDPTQYMVACYDSSKNYWSDELILTPPVACGPSSEIAETGN